MVGGGALSREGGSFGRHSWIGWTWRKKGKASRAQGKAIKDVALHGDWQSTREACPGLKKRALSFIFLEICGIFGHVRQLTNLPTSSGSVKAPGYHCEGAVVQSIIQNLGFRLPCTIYIDIFVRDLANLNFVF